MASLDAVDPTRRRTHEHTPRATPRSPRPSRRRRHVDRGRQWDRPTPCPPWTVRQLTGHVIDGQRQVIAMLSAEGRPAPERSPAELARLAGADPAATWPHVRDVAITALIRVDDAAVVPTPLGDTPVSQLLETAVIEPLLHTWDLATAAGGTADLDAETVEATLAGVEALGDRLAATGMYAPARPVRNDMCAQGRLLALTGRG